MYLTEEKNMSNEIENKINQILKRGTRVVSFDYHGKRRNVLVGASQIANDGVWGVQENRAIRKHNGKSYLVGIVNNDHAATVKCFALDKISNPSAVLA